MNPFYTTGIFLVGIIFHFYLLIVMLRLLLQYYGARWHNPISQFVIKLTQPLVKPLQKIIPGYKGIDFAIVFLLIVLVLIKNVLIALLQAQTLPNVIGLSIWSFGTLINIFLDIYFWAILIRVILSWVNPMSGAPFQEILFIITEPVMLLARRIIPAVGGLDFSPIVLIIAIKVIEFVVANLLMSWGIMIAL